MSSAGDRVQEEARLIRRARLESIGLADQYDLWRETMPEQDIPDNEAHDMFLKSHQLEEAALKGTLSVSTGGIEVDSDTTIPAPGPDDEETRPDEGGEASKGGGPDPTDLRLVEGMWTPPPEAEAENYEGPSTYQMSRSKDWLENARIMYDFMNPVAKEIPSGTDVVFGGIMGPSGPGRGDRKELSDDELGEWARNELSGFNWNIVNTLNYAQKIMSSDDPKVALSFLNLINMYDHSDGSMMDFMGALGEIATDPTTYVGAGAGGFIAKGVAKATAKSALKKMVKMAIVGGSAGAVEGGVVAGGFNLAVQNVEKKVGAREEIDAGEVAIATGMGIGLGTILGSAGGAYVGRKADKFLKAIADFKAADKARNKLLDLRAGQEFGAEELMKFLQRASGVTGDELSGITAKMAKRILGEDGLMPRLDDGSLDYETMIRHITDVRNEHAAKLQKEQEGRAKGMFAGKLDNFTENSTGHLKMDSNASRFDEFLQDIRTSVKGGARPKVQNLDPSEVTAMQRDVLTEFDPDMKQPSTDAAERNKAGEGVIDDYNDKPVVYRLDGELYILDGHHRFDNAVETGGKVEAYVFDASTDIITKGAGSVGAKPLPDIPDKESQALIDKILELQELEKGDVVMRTDYRPGSKVINKAGETFEVVGRTKNGWYRLRDTAFGRTKNLRRKDFEVIEKAPPPEKAGPMELDPFSDDAAKLIEMNERVVSGKLVEVKMTHKEVRAMAKELEGMGINFADPDSRFGKKLSDHWEPHELFYLRDVYDRQSIGILDMARMLDSKIKNEGRILDSDMARFNNAHSMLVATRDLFYGVSGNAARQLNILRSRPTSGVYDLSQSIMDSIGIQGGRANTERAISMMSKFASEIEGSGKIGLGKGVKDKRAAITKMSENIWGNPKAAMLLNIRYNMMLSSWRTHVFNFIGNSASGVYQHLMVSPVKMGINNLTYMRELAWSRLAPGTKYGPAPDPADRLTRLTYYAELRGHYASARDSWMLAKEILMGRDIGEGKVWTELGLRYHVINIPDSATGLALTFPVRALEAGDAFFKRQYYGSKIHELASLKARREEIYDGKNYKEQYQHYVDNPEEIGGSAERIAKEFAAKQTYTNDPNIYSGLLSIIADSVAKAQNKSLIVNMIIPFVRTPANLLNYSMEMIGANALPGMGASKTWNAILKGSAQDSQEALARLTVAAGLWLVVAEMYQNGDISGTGPSNWEERQVWEAAGWQANSIKVWGHWVSMSRAAPGGQSLATIASIFDFYAMTQQQNKPALEWVGAGLLYTADMILDESYLSTVMDVVTAISSKEGARIRSSGASMINSIFVPNFLRDLRRPADEQKRSITSSNLLDQVHKQAMNASPWHSKDLAPQRDWRGAIKDYFGNAYFRGLIPFDVKNPDNNDPGSMALAYARIPVSKPDTSIAWPNGTGDGVDLMAMDNGKGYVYDEFLKIMGANREYAVEILMDTPFWHQAVEDNNIGPGSDGDFALREAVSLGSQFGRMEMLTFLIEHSDDNSMYTRVGPEGEEVPYLIQHPVSVAEYIRLRDAVREEGHELTEEETQYIIKRPVEGPEFFKP